MVINIDIKEKLVEGYLSGESTVKLSQKYGIHYSTIRNILISNGVTMRSNKDNSRRYTVDETMFDKIDTEEKAYWFGFLMADGYVSKSNGKRVGLSIGSCDRKHIEKFNSFMCSTYQVKEYTVPSGYKPGTKYCRVIYASDHLYDTLVCHGMVEHKSCILKYPYNEIDGSLHCAFIRGYTDGDGCITGNGKTFSYCLEGTEDFLNGVIAMLNSSTDILHYSFRKRREECPVTSLRASGKSAYNIIKALYGDSPTVFLERKYKKANEAIEYFSRLYQQ